MFIESDRKWVSFLFLVLDFGCSLAVLWLFQNQNYSWNVNRDKNYKINRWQDYSNIKICMHLPSLSRFCEPQHLLLFRLADEVPHLRE